jgi:hypothetical protein
MSETLLEIKVADGVKNNDNSFFQTVYGEPLLLQKGSTIDFVTAFLDLGAQSQNIIEIPNNLQLGIDFYRYEYDISKVPSAWGTDAPFYDKRTIYYGEDYTIIDPMGAPGVPDPPLIEKYGFRDSTYRATNLCSFLLTRTAPTVDDDVNHIRTDTFAPVKQTAVINIKKGNYTKVKLTQIINDEFNLIKGGVTNTDKPYENKTNPTTPLDYQLSPNNKSVLLTAYEYKYNTTTVTDPVLSNLGLEPNKYYPSDKTWNNWFVPVFTTPTDPTYFIDYDFLPYVWWQDGQSGFLSGTTKFNLEYDADNDLFYIDYAHSPILNQDQKEVVVFSKSQQSYGSPKAECIGYKANGSAGGILISRLFSYELDDNFNIVSNTNSGFWQDVLGFAFDDADAEQFENDFITKNISFAANGVDGVSGAPVTNGFYKFTITYPNPSYLETNTTSALIPIQWLQQSNYTDNKDDNGFSIKTNDLPKVFDSIGNRPIYGDQKGYLVPSSHYLVEVNISHVKNDNYRDKDSYYQIMSVAGKTYNSGSNYIQTFDDGSVQTLNIEEDVYIDKIEVRFLNPDKSVASGLGSNSTVFLKLTQPVTLG